MIRRLVPIIAVLALLAVPAAAGAGAPGNAPVASIADATVKIKLGKVDRGRAKIYSTVPVFGTIKPFVPGQKVTVDFFLNGKQLVGREVRVNKGSGEWGTFRASVLVRKDGRYAASATHEATDAQRGDSTVRKSWKVSYPSLRRGQCGEVVVGFKRALRKMGYIANSGKCFGAKTGRGVLAYRTVNGKRRSPRAGAGIVRAVFAGRGGYRVRHPNAGEHVEVPLSKKVLVFVKDDKAFAIYPISAGKYSTPTVTGRFEFFRTEAGYNNLEMYYSFYFHRGYAVHGYKSVPDYPASHGCLRTFIADQPEVYNLINFGEDIFIW